MSFNLGGRELQWGGSWEVSDERRKNFDLNRARARDRHVREHELKLEARHHFDARTLLFMQVVGLDETRQTQGDAKQRRRALERGRMVWQRERLFETPWTLQLGRLAWLDRRAWWWDEDLDGVRLRWNENAWQLETGVAREWAKVSTADAGITAEQKGVTRWFGQATWAWTPRHAVDGFWLVHRDASTRPVEGDSFENQSSVDSTDLQAQWLGLRSRGEWRPQDGPRLTYWADLAFFSGQERLTAFAEQADGSQLVGSTTARRLRGQALDLGITGAWPQLPFRPSLTAAYARGSRDFRQTGLQENKVRFAGVKRWQRYGELMQPELSNVAITTFGAGVRWLDNTSLEFTTHEFRQVEAATSVRASRLGTSPEGTNTALGREWNVLVAVRESKHVEFLFKAAQFKPGPAFAPNRRDKAHSLEAGVVVNF